MCETGTGQQVAQLPDRYMMVVIVVIKKKENKVIEVVGR
jgi:hypothetical protein